MAASVVTHFGDEIRLVVSLPVSARIEPGTARQLRSDWQRDQGGAGKPMVKASDLEREQVLDYYAAQMADDPVVHLEKARSCP